MLKRIAAIVISLIILLGISTHLEVVYAGGIKIAADTKTAEEDGFRVNLAMVSHTEDYTKDSFSAGFGNYIFIIFNKPINSNDVCLLKYYAVPGTSAKVMAPRPGIGGLEYLDQYAITLVLSENVSTTSSLQISKDIKNVAGEPLENGGLLRLPYGYEKQPQDNENPLIVTEPGDVSLKDNNTSFSFQVTASGGKSSEYIYAWYYTPSKNGKGVNLYDLDFPFLQDPPNKIRGFINIAAEDGIEVAGYYYCVVSDGVSTVESKRAKLTIVHTKQEIKVYLPEKRRIEYKGKADLMASAEGKISYKSSNSNVISVSAKGDIKAKNYGKAVITIHASATKKYDAVDKKITLSVVPRRPVIKKADLATDSAGQPWINFTWKQDKAVDGYQYNVAYNSSFTKGMSGMKSCKENGLKMHGINTEKIRMYMRVRAYKKVGTKTLYGDWSEVYYVDLKKN